MKTFRVSALSILVAAFGAVFSLSAFAENSQSDPGATAPPAAQQAAAAGGTSTAVSTGFQSSGTGLPATSALDVPPSISNSAFDGGSRSTAGFQGFRDGGGPFVNVNDRSAANVGAQTQAVRTADSNDQANRFVTELPVGNGGGGAASVQPGRTEFLGEPPGLDANGTRSFPSAPGGPGSPSAATVVPVGSVGVAAPLVSTENQILTAGVTRPSTPETVLDTAVGRLVDVDRPRAEITVSDQFSGKNVTLAVSPAIVDDLEEGALVKAQYEPRTLRAEAVLVQEESQR